MEYQPSKTSLALVLVLALLILLHAPRTVSAGVGFLTGSATTTTTAHKFCWPEKSRGTKIHSLPWSIPTFSETRIESSSSSQPFLSSADAEIAAGDEDSTTTTDTPLQHQHQNLFLKTPNATAVIETKGKLEKRPSLFSSSSSSSVQLFRPSLPSFLQLLPLGDTEFFIGITPQTIFSKTLQKQALQMNPCKTKTTIIKRKKKMDLREGMTEALEELRTMRREMDKMHKDLAKIKQLQVREDHK